jgi:hypothetical protein
MPRQKSIRDRIVSHPVEQSQRRPDSTVGSAPHAFAGRHRRVAQLRGALAGALVAAALAPACASYQELTVASNPPDAEVFLDQQPVGKTPLQVRVERTRDHALYVKKDGYQPELVVLTLRSARDGRRFLTPADVYVDLRRGRGTAGEGDAGLPERSAPTLGPGTAAPGAPPGERDRDLQIDPAKSQRPPIR